VSLFDWLRPAADHPRRSFHSGARRCRRCVTVLPAAARFCFICGRPQEDAAVDPWMEEPQPGGSFAELQARLAHALDGRYRVREILGAGGMGVVFLADDLGLDRAVAIKVLPPDVAGDATVVSRFRREAKTAARLDHPGIIPIYRVESEGGLDYFIMKYVPGRSLDTVLRDESPLSIPFATRVLREASAALAHAHGHGVVHRDVKPANILITTDGVAKVTDFGIARALGDTSSRLTTPGYVMGTARYLAPEQLRDQPIDPRADVYSLGLVLHHAITGRPPFGDGSAVEVAMRRLSGDLPPVSDRRPDVPPALDDAIARATQLDPADRFLACRRVVAVDHGNGKGRHDGNRDHRCHDAPDGRPQSGPQCRGRACGTLTFVIRRGVTDRLSCAVITGRRRRHCGPGRDIRVRGGGT
jgi:predicted Ser/Thr protein kinase